MKSFFIPKKLTGEGMFVQGFKPIHPLILESVIKVPYPIMYYSLAKVTSIRNKWNNFSDVHIHLSRYPSFSGGERFYKFIWILQEFP